MFQITSIFEEKQILEYLETRNILKQYKKSKENILAGVHTGNRLGYKNPRKYKILYFRINRKFRALCRFVNDKELIVFAIDDHQN